MKNHVRQSRLVCCLLLTVFAVSACGKSTESETASVASLRDMSTEERLAQPANAENGERLFLACAICHDVRAEAGHRVGPNLWGIYEAPVARHTDFAYSKALRESGIVWDADALDAYLESPIAVVPRGRMAYAGEKDAANRRDLIEYLKTLK